MSRSNCSKNFANSSSHFANTPKNYVVRVFSLMSPSTSSQGSLPGGLPFSVGSFGTPPNPGGLAPPSGTALVGSVIPVLPLTPTSGQIYLFQNALMVASGAPPWQMLWTGSTWQCVGASGSLSDYEPTSAAMGAVGVYTSFADTQPSILLPFTLGDYEVDFGASITSSIINGGNWISPFATGFSPSGNIAAIEYIAGVVNQELTISRRVNLLGISGTLSLAFFSALGGSAAQRRYLSLRPLGNITP